MKKEHEAPVVSQAGAPLPTPLPVASETFGAETGGDEADTNPKLPKNAVWQPDGTVLLTLRKPVVQNATDQGGAAVEHLVREIPFHPLTGAAMLRIQAQKDDGQRAMVMMQESSGLFGPVGADVFKRMDARDFVASMVIASIFTNPGL